MGTGETQLDTFCWVVERTQPSSVIFIPAYYQGLFPLWFLQTRGI